MLFFALLIGVLQLAVAGICYANMTRSLPRVLWFITISFFLILFGGPATLLMTVIVTIIMVAASSAGASQGRFLTYSVLSLIVVFAGLSAAPLREAVQRVTLRSAFPFESLAGRLDYESKRAGEPAPQKLTTAARLEELAAFEERLEAEEPRVPWRGNRARALAQIHESQVRYFVNSPGFGLVRMMPRSPVTDADIAAVTSIVLPGCDPVDVDGTPTPSAALPRTPTRESAPAEPPSPARLRQLHQDSAVDFVNQNGWGYVRHRDEVAGFQVHHFRMTPSLGPTAPSSIDDEPAHARDRTSGLSAIMPADEEWAVRTVELVSLLKYDEPKVYVTAELPRMDKLSEAPVRELNPFEQRALRELEAGEESVNQASLNRVDMVGAIRAARQCLQCHQVERGELLGAFTYVIERVRPVRQELPSEEPVF